MLPAARIRVLVAPSDPLISLGLVAVLGERCDFEATLCSPATTAASNAAHSADVVVADYESGLRLIAAAGAASPRVVILTHSDSEARICHALEQGACGYLLLGCSLRDLLDGLRSAHQGDIAVGPLVASRIAERMKRQMLTVREADILQQMMLGLSNKAIAARLAVA